MSVAPAILDSILKAPEGPQTVAFFDMDGTLINGFSVVFFVLEGMRSGALPASEALQQFVELVQGRFRGDDYADLLNNSAQALAGKTDSDLISLGESVFDKYVSAALYPESRALVRAHQARGHRIVIISTATPYQVLPVARELAIADVICNRFGAVDGVLDGSLDGPMIFGEGKLTAAKKYLKKHKGKLANSFFYSDGMEDMPLLKATGFPRPTNPDKQLSVIARKNLWPIQAFHSRGLPGPREWIRTGLSYGSFVGTALAIAPTWLLNRSRRDTVNLGTSIWGEVGSALTGMKLDIVGEHHLWSHRPAVFVFNHQSASDPLILARLLRRDFTGIAKKELAMHPLAGPVFRIADTVFVDRSNSASAVASMKSVGKTIEQGLSIVVAPEGTRSVGDRLGPFKKGPFHIALDSRVPVVPIVIHNSTDVLPKSGVFMRAATVRVEVLEPISTIDWREGTLTEHVDEVRQLFLQALGQSDPSIDAPSS